MEEKNGWTIDAGTVPFRPSQKQRELLEELERVIDSFGPRPKDHQQILVQITPLVVELAATGMTSNQIADHSRVRPRAVAGILEETEES